MEGEKNLSFEYQEVKKRHIQFIPLTAGRLQRVLTKYSFASLLKIPIGFLQSFKLLSQVKPDGLISFGGYIALPISFAAKVLGITIITHEQTTIPGLANRLIFYFADKVCISWKSEKNQFPKNKTIYTGNPIRSAFIHGREEAVTTLGSKPLLYISGGSLGSHIINKTVGALIPRLITDFSIVHQCGSSSLTDDLTYLQTIRRELPESLRPDYLIRDYFSERQVVWLMKHSKLVVSRAGANTVTELAYIGRPALLIPLAIAGGSEQMANAQLLEDAGLAKVVTESQLNKDRLFKTIMGMIQQIGTYERSAISARHLVKPFAAEAFADVVEETLKPDSAKRPL